MQQHIQERIDALQRGKVPQGYKETPFGVVPAKWSYAPLSKFIERVESPVDVKADELYTQIGIRSHGKGLFHKEPVTGASLGNKKVYWIEPDCFVLNIVFAWEQAVGKTTEAEKGMIGSHRFPMYKPVNNDADVDYLTYVFLTKRGKNILEIASPGGAGRNKTLGQDRFMKSKIALPPLAEQQKIAAILSTCDKLITLQVKLIAAKERQKKYLMQQLLTGKKRLPGFSGEWKKRKLKEIGNFAKGNGLSKEELAAYGEVYAIPYTSLYTDFAETFDEFDILKYTNDRCDEMVTRDKPCLLLAGSSNMLENIGRCAGYVGSTEIAIGGDIIIFDTLQNISFLAYLLADDLHRTNLIRLSQGATIRHLYSYQLEPYQIDIPPLPEQIAIAEILATADKEIDLLKQTLEQEKRKKKALMQLLLTGVVRV